MCSDQRTGKGISDDSLNIENKICEHIQSFPTIDSHYNREKEKNNVKYLDISLSIKKMWELFNNSENNIQVPYIKYYRTFHTKFDIKFQQCQIDIYDTCTKLNEQIKNSNNNNKINFKEELTKQLILADQFYKSIKNKITNLY